jgi:hypothetical protein
MMLNPANRAMRARRKQAWQRRQDEQALAAKRERAVKKAGNAGLTAAGVILRDQLAARVAAETAAAIAERQRAMASDEPPPEPAPGPFSKLFNSTK